MDAGTEIQCPVSICLTGLRIIHTLNVNIEELEQIKVKSEALSRLAHMTALIVPPEFWNCELAL